MVAVHLARTMWLLFGLLLLHSYCAADVELPLALDGDGVGSGPQPSEVSTDWVPKVGGDYYSSYYATRITTHFDQELFLLDSAFCPARGDRLPPPDGASLLPPVPQPCPDCDFASQCPATDDTSPACCVALFNAAVSTAFLGARPPASVVCPRPAPAENNPLELALIGLGALTAAAPLQHNVTLIGQSLRGYPIASRSDNYLSFFLPSQLARSAYALRGVFRPRIGAVDMAVSQYSQRPALLRPRAAVSPWLAWRGSSPALGDEVSVRICLDDDDDPSTDPSDAGLGTSGTYFVQLSCRAVICIGELVFWLQAPPTAATAPLPAPVYTTAELAAHTTLTDGVPVRLTFDRRAPVYAAFRFAAPALLDITVEHDHTRVSVQLAATDDANDPLVSDPLWRLDSAASSQSLALSFHPSSGAASTVVYVKLTPRALGSALLSASTRAAFSAWRLAALPPLTARFRLLGAASLRVNGTVYRCAKVGTDSCDEFVWPLAASDGLSINPLIASTSPLQQQELPSSQQIYLPYDFTPQALLAVRRPLNNSFTAFWVNTWLTNDGVAMVFPPGFPPASGTTFIITDAPVASFGLAFQRRVVNARGVQVRDPASQQLNELPPPQCHQDWFELGVELVRNFRFLQLSDWFSTLPPGQLSGWLITLRAASQFQQLVNGDWLSECSRLIFAQYLNASAPSEPLQLPASQCILNQTTDDPCCSIEGRANDVCCPPYYVNLSLDQNVVPLPDTPGCQSDINGLACFLDEINQPPLAQCRTPICSLSSLNSISDFTGSSGLLLGCPFWQPQSLFLSVSTNQCRPNAALPSSATLGLRCLTDDDCRLAGGRCDMALHVCIDSQNIQDFSNACRQTSASPLLRNILAITLDQLGTPPGPACRPVDGGPEPLRSLSSWTLPVDPYCDDETTQHRAAVSSLQRTETNAFPYYERVDVVPADRCQREAVVWPDPLDLVAVCNDEQTFVCNWHACTGCTAAECQRTCLYGDLSQTSTCLSADGPPPPVLPVQEFCAVCPNERQCRLVPDAASAEACAQRRMCELPADGSLLPCTGVDELADRAVCSERCPGQSCTSFVFGDGGVCATSALRGEACTSRNGDYIDWAQLCYFPWAYWPQQCPFDWLQCSALTVDQCTAFGSDARNAFVQCFVDGQTACTSSEQCAAAGGTCDSETAFNTMMPLVDGQSMSPRFVARHHYRTSLPSPYLNPPADWRSAAGVAVWGACVFDGDDAYTYLNTQRYCRQWRNNGSSTSVRTTSDGCVDYSYRSPEQCRRDGGAWLTPAVSEAECRARQVNCGDRFVQTPVTPGACTSCRAASGANLTSRWRAGRWLPVQLRQPAWTRRSFASTMVSEPNSTYYSEYASRTFEAVVQNTLKNTLGVARSLCLYAPAIQMVHAVLCDCYFNASSTDCYAPTNASIPAQVCSGLEFEYGLDPIVMRFSTASLPLEMGLCAAIDVQPVSFRNYLNQPPPPSGLLASAATAATFTPSLWRARLLAVRNSSGAVAGYLVGDGATLRIQPVTLNGTTFKLPLASIADVELCFHLKRDNLAALSDAARADGSFRLGVVRGGVVTALDNVPPVHADPPQWLLDNLLMVVCFANVSFARLCGGNDTAVTLLPVVVSSSADASGLSDYSVALFAAITGLYGLCALQALFCLLLSLVFQRATPNSTHVVYFGLFAFLTIRLFYFGFLAAQATSAWSPIVDFALIEAPSFILAATFVVMLVLWIQFLRFAERGRGTWLLIVAVDAALFLLLAMFIGLFAAFPATPLVDEASCGAVVSPENTGYSRSSQQQAVELACHSFIVAFSLLLAAMFVYVAVTFVRLFRSEGYPLASLFHFKRASRVTTKKQQAAKVFQTLLLLAVFFLADSLFLLIFYLFTNYYSSSWSVYVLVVVEVLPCALILYQLHPKWTFKPIYGTGSFRSSSPTQPVSVRESIDTSTKPDANNLFTTDAW